MMDRQAPLLDRVVYRVQFVGIAWMWFCSWLWLAALAYFFYRKVGIERWRPHRLSDFVFLVIVLPLAVFPFLVTKLSRRLVVRSSPDKLPRSSL
jgi:hypothetical protein